MNKISVGAVNIFTSGDLGVTKTETMLTSWTEAVGFILAFLAKLV